MFTNLDPAESHLEACTAGKSQAELDKHVQQEIEIQNDLGKLKQSLQSNSSPPEANRGSTE